MGSRAGSPLSGQPWPEDPAAPAALASGRGAGYGGGSWVMKIGAKRASWDVFQKLTVSLFLILTDSCSMGLILMLVMFLEMRLL